MKSKAMNSVPAAIVLTPDNNRMVRFGIWSGVGLFFLVFFTLIKLPDDRLKSFINGTISAQLAQKGMTFSAQETHLSYLFGVTYSLKDVTFNFPAPAPPAHIDEIEVSPSILGLLVGSQGGTLKIYHRGGELRIAFSIRKTKTSVNIYSKAFDLGKTGLLPVLSDFQASAILDGKGNLDGDLASPSTLEGNLNFNIKKLVIDAQSIQGFRIPELNLSEGEIDISIDRAKASLKNVKLGKPGNAADDIQGTVTGEAILGKSWNLSQLNLKLHFSLSESLKKAFILLDALLGTFKQEDGSYAMSLTGPLESPTPGPAK